MALFQQQCLVYIGTYGQGIYGFSLDVASGKLQPLGVVAEIMRPPYLALSSSGQYLYSIMNIEVDGKSQGAIGAFKIDRATGKLQTLNVQPLGGKAPCHLNLDRDNHHLFAANYDEGTVAAFWINPDGSVGTLLDESIHQGAGPNRQRQDRPHAHYVAMTPDGRHLCAVDLGSDKIAIYEVSPAGLKLCEDLSMAIRPGSGPRHLVFHPDRNYVYLITELSSELIVLEYASEQPWKTVQTISALPSGYTGDNLGAAIQVAPNSRFVYASNRGHDSIAVFRVDVASGQLTLVGHTSTLGKWPRDLAIDPTGKMLIVANQNSDEIVTFKIDSESGRLQALEHYPVPSPSCVKYLCQ